MNKLLLHDIHEQNGAEFEEFKGWLLPSKYRGVKEEYLNSTGGIGVIDMSNRGKLRLSGKEHIKFLQGMLSNDVLNLETGKGVYSTLLTIKGRMIADMYVFKDKDYVFIDLEQDLNKVVFELLMKYRLSYKVVLDDVTDNFVLLSFIGPKSADYLSSFFDKDLSVLETKCFINIDFDSTSITVVKMRRSRLGGFDVYIPIEKLVIMKDILFSEFDNKKPMFIGYDAFEVLRVEAGIPKYRIDMDEKTIPIEAGIWDALSFEKGCYVGQEVIARIKWRGHVNRHLVGIEIEGDNMPSYKDKIYREDKEIGYLTSPVFSYLRNKIVSMGYIRREFKEPGNKVRIVSGDSNLVGKVFNFE